MIVNRSYRDHVLSRLTERRERANESINAAEKSLRKYPTWVFDPYRERWDFWYDTGIRERIEIHTTSYVYLDGSGDKWKPSHMMNWVMGPIFSYDFDLFSDVIEVKLSRTTFLQCKRSIREVIKNDLEDIGSRLNAIPSILDYATSLLGWNTVNDLFSDVKSSKMMLSINEFLVKNNFSFPATTYVKIDGRECFHDLIMDVKYYPNRDDNRAYCKDKNKLRALAGAALQKLILPKRMVQRSKLEYVREVVPAKNKDKVKQRVTKTKGYIHLVTIIDISNFTGSAANAWLMLAIVAIELAHGKISGKRDNVYCCDGAHFHASALEVIVLYLYLTIGYPCTLQDTGEVRFLPGGFLGVNANICVAMLFYANLLGWLSRNKGQYIKYMKSQAGGDDVYILTKIRRDDVFRTRMWLQENLSKYVGNIKELNSFVVEDSCDSDVVDGIKFCRKRIGVTELSDSYLIESEPAVPLNEVLTMVQVPKKQATQEKLMETVSTELRSFEFDHPKYHWLTDALLVIASSKLPLAKITRTITQRFECELDFELVENRLCTTKSVERARLVPLVCHEDRIYYDTIGTSINYLLCRGVLTMQKVSITGVLHKVVMLDKEAKYYRKNCVTKLSWDDVAIADQALVEYLK